MFTDIDVLLVSFWFMLYFCDSYFWFGSAIFSVKTLTEYEGKYILWSYQIKFFLLPLIFHLK